MSSLQDAIESAGATEAVTAEGEFAEYVEEETDDSYTEPKAAPGSVLSVLRARAKALREEQTTDIDVPGYEGWLVARYQAVSIGEVFARAKAMQTPLNPDWQLAADVLSRAVVEVLMRDNPNSDELHPLATDASIRFDDDLVEFLELQPEARTARAVVVALCGGGALGESRVWAHYMQYQGWLMAGSDTDNMQESEIATRAVGESTAG